jgi:hypothetical protein
MRLMMGQHVGHTGSPKQSLTEYRYDDIQLADVQSRHDGNVESLTQGSALCVWRYVRGLEKEEQKQENHANRTSRSVTKHNTKKEKKREAN